MEEYVCLTVRSGSSEPVPDFNRRLIAFWSEVLRTYPDEYEQVYAETSRYSETGDRVTRQYLVGTEVWELIVQKLTAAGIEIEPVDPDDLYSKFEATPPDWFQIPH